MLAKHLHDLVHCGDVKQGVLVLLNNYITQSLSDDKSVLICLDLTIVGLHDSTIDSPSEYIPPSPNVIEEIEFVGVSSEGVCSHCEQMPCEWLLYGPTNVHSVRATHGSNPNVDRLLTKKPASMLHTLLTPGPSLVISGRATEYHYPNVLLMVLGIIFLIHLLIMLGSLLQYRICHYRHQYLLLNYTISNG
jgi:hypothetical protein